LSGLSPEPEDGNGLDEQDLAVQLALVAMAAQEPTIGLIAGGIDALARDPEGCARLRDDREVDEAAVEELLRLLSPVQMRPRIATRHVVIGGVEFRPGDRVLAFVAAANRDPAMFAAPDELELTRDPNPHLAFGLGRHRCLGNHLVRLQARVALTSFVRRLRVLSLGSGTTYEHRFAVRLPAEVVLDTRSDAVSTPTVR
jgi:cytochrome P450